MPDVRVITWNVRSLRDDPRAVEAGLRAIAPDVVCLQEAPRFLRSRTRLAALARRSDLLFVEGGRAGAGTALLVAMRVKVIDARAVRLPRTSGFHRRGLTSALLDVGGARLGVASSHLGLDSAERLRHADAVLADARSWHAPATVIGADLNERPGAPAWALWSAGLTDVAGVDGEPTFPSARATSRIDSIFFAGAELISTSVADSASASAASDHLAVVADLRLSQ